MIKYDNPIDIQLYDIYHGGFPFQLHDKIFFKYERWYVIMTKSERIVEVNKLLNSKAFKTGDVAKVMQRVKGIYPLYTKMSCIDGQLCKCLLKAIPKQKRTELRMSTVADYINTVQIGR